MGLMRRMRVVGCTESDDGEDSTDTGLKIGFATTDMKHVNQHFGSAESFAIYSVARKPATRNNGDRFIIVS